MIFLLQFSVFLLMVVPFGAVESNEYFDFAFNIAKRSIVSENRNLVLSTVSLTEVLLLLYEGTSHSSAELLRSAMKLKDKPSQREAYLSAKGKLMSSSDPEQRYTLNSIVVTNVDVKDKYRRIVEDDYGGVVVSNGDKKINLNKIIAEKFNFTGVNFDFPTQNIEKNDVILKLYCIDEFKHRWLSIFDPSMTKSTTFYNENGINVTVPYMRNVGEYKIYDNKQLSVLSIPYKNENFSLLILFPNRKESLSAIYDSLDKTTLLNLVPTEYENIEVSIPKFELKTSVSLLKYFNETNLQLLMQEIHISDMTDDSGYEHYLGEAQQNSVFKVDEYGTKTTSVSYLSISRRNLPRMVRINRPFIMAIYNEELKIFTHLGKVVNLKERN